MPPRFIAGRADVQGLAKRLARCRRGATAIEYGLIVALIVIALVGGLSKLGGGNGGSWGNTAARIAAVEP